MYVLGVDPIEFFKENLSQVKVMGNGQVNLCYIENLPFIDIEGQSNNSNNESKDMVQCRVVGAFFQLPAAGKNQFYMRNASFQHVFDFPKEAQKNLATMNDRRKSHLDRQINSIRASQARLPKQLFDYTQYENKIDELLRLETKKCDYVYSKIYC